MRRCSTTRVSRFGDEAYDFMGEIFIERIEPGDDGVEHQVPEGYEENGIWIRGEHDYAHPQVAGAIGSGWDPAMMAYIAEARWVERRIVLDDAVEQVETVTAEDWAMGEERWSRWREVGAHEGLRYVNWIAPYSRARYAQRTAASDAAAVLVRGRDRDPGAQADRAARGGPSRRQRPHREPCARTLARQ